MATTAWRSELTEESRKDLITKMYHQLSRVSGEADKARIWSSAAKFELMLYNQSENKSEYMTKLAKKIHSLSKKPTVQPGANPSIQQQQQPKMSNQAALTQQKNQPAQQPQQFNQFSGFQGQSTGNLQPQSQQQQQQMLRQQQQILQQNQSQQGQQMQQRQAQTTQLQQKLHQLKQQQQQLLQHQQKVQQQQQQGFVLQAHRLQQQQQQQQIPQEVRLQQQQQLQHQQQLQRTQIHQQNQMQNNQIMTQVQQLQTQLQGQLKPDQSRYQQAQAQQAQQRSQQRTQQQQQNLKMPLKHNTGSLETPGSTSGSLNAYTAKLKLLKQKYWNDLTIVYKEFTKLALQPKTNDGMQQEKVHSFLANLRRAMAVLNNDSTKAENMNVQDLDKVEQHIIRVVMPILTKLKSEKSKRVPVNPDAQLASAQTKPKVDAVAPTQPSTQNLSKRPSVDTVPISSVAPKTMSLTAEQYRSFKKTAEEKLKLQQDHARLVQEQTRVVMQQQRTKTPMSQQRLAQSAQKVAQSIARISQQIAQSKLADNYEQAFKEANKAHAAPTSSVSTAAPTTQVKRPPSVAPALRDATASQRLLALTQMLEKTKPEVLVEVAKKMATISHTLGFRLEHSFQRVVSD